LFERFERFILRTASVVIGELAEDGLYPEEERIQKLRRCDSVKASLCEKYQTTRSWQLNLWWNAQLFPAAKYVESNSHLRLHRVADVLARNKELLQTRIRRRSGHPIPNTFSGLPSNVPV